MLDKQFLDKVVSAVSFLVETMPKQMIVIKDHNSDHIFCSSYLATLVGILPKEIIGKKIWFPLYNNDKNFEKIILEEDKSIIKSREPQMLLKINKFSTGLMPYFSMKSPLINPITNHVVGLLFQGFEISATVFEKHIMQITTPDKTKLKVDRPKLSRREKQVIFFFMANLSSQEIAEILYTIEEKCITKSTIDNIFNDQLYMKFNVHSRIALYKKLKSFGYDQLIPTELLSITSMALDVMSVY